MSNIHFPRGTYVLNDDPNFNFQLNRVIQWDVGRLEDVQPVAMRIHTSADWKRELISLGDSAMQEQRIEDYITAHYGGRVCAVYGCSLDGSIVSLMAARGRIRMDYGILGGSDLDQSGTLTAKLQTVLMLKLLLPLLRTGRLKSEVMQRFLDKCIAKCGAYGQAMLDMFGMGRGGLPFVQAESVRNQFYSDLVTVLPDAIDPPQTEINILYALKMGEKYRARYQKHFAHPVLHELELHHEELLAVYPKEWVKTVETISKVGGASC